MSSTDAFLSRNTLCRTLANNKCEYTTITSKERPEVSYRNSNNRGEVNEKEFTYKLESIQESQIVLGS